ncbi:hypothetical protein PMAC_001053 [Pneumocystis sp. 'macacae']|nr:hypothetical protein PMAC_001053 [Pneumocystis sp. 'macacae']
MSGQELLRGKDKVVCTRGRVKEGGKGGWEEGVHQVARGGRGGEGEVGWGYKVCNTKRGWRRNEVRSRRSTGGSEVDGVHEVEVEEVCTRHRGGMGEVGCEKNVYGADKVVCTKQPVGGRVQVRVYRDDKIRGGGEVGGSGDKK